MKVKTGETKGCSSSEHLQWKQQQSREACYVPSVGEGCSVENNSSATKTQRDALRFYRDVRVKTDEHKRDLLQNNAHDAVLISTQSLCLFIYRKGYLSTLFQF